MMRRLGPADYRDMPWKNGGGVTRELLKLPHPSDPARFLARLSIASVAAPGPFSVFPGVDRVLMILEGAGVALSFGSGPEVVLDRRWRPLAFPGEAEVQCRLLGGPVRDFNLMVDRASAEATLAVVHLGPGETRTLSSASTVFLHALEGQASVEGTPLTTEETLWMAAPEALALRSDTGAVVAAIHLNHRT
ncbi:HutD/Ves family protein [Archangium lipolyticum]|uniref:HutD/Ves family protein n=1 Tax=Archangium lipolyticum TaxID=2970465 RepID=UPI00214A74A8|nr:HutD family protein [Archangium lipolyticum]